ncbi:MAG: CapA family protein [Clostridia bacterium]|nr:CapA family protein [Clostridia bacterium]
MKFTATGDSLMIQGYPEEGYDGFYKVREFIERGEARFGNLETTLIDGPCYASTYCGGTWIRTESRIADKVLGFGFNFLGVANNHIMDYGPDGLFETLEHLKEREVAFAGAGADLYEAAKPVYRDLPSGRVAFMSICSSFNDAARAGWASKSTVGRPGLNPLRSSLELQLTRKHFNALCEILDSTKLMGEKEISIQNGFTPPFPKDMTLFGETLCKVSPDGVERKVTHPNKYDLERTLDFIKEAKWNADYVVIMLHSHQIAGNVMNIPAQFAEEFCRAVIDGGADMVIGGGTHELKPIEIYKGKPIFYSLGNFVFQSNVVTQLPPDFVERYNMPKDLSDSQALALRCKGWKIGLHAQDKNFLTVVPLVDFEGGKLKSVELMPVELGFNKPRTFKGIPYPASAADTKRIFKVLSDLSAPYGTTLSIKKDGLIKIKL